MRVEFPVLPAVVKANAVSNRPVLQVPPATGDKNMDKIELKPRYSTVEIPGKCLKCLLAGYRRVILKGG